MEEKKKDKKIYIIIGLAVLGVIILATGSYAFWSNKIRQTNRNEIATACLDISYTNESPEIYVDGIMTETDEAGAKLTPYSFRITNNCDYYVTYHVAIESLADPEKSSQNANTVYINDDYVKFKLDDYKASVYSSLTDLTDDTNTGYTIRDTKELGVNYLGPNEYKTHNIRIWLDEDTPTSEMKKEFLSKVKVYTGINDSIEYRLKADDDECFTVEDGVITAINNITGCTGRIVFPDEIDGVPITGIDSQIFANLTTSSTSSAIVNLEKMKHLTSIADNAFCRNASCTNTSGMKSENSEGMLIIPSTVTSIGNNAFRMYTGKANTPSQTLLLPDSILTIGTAAFYTFNGNYLKLPNAITEIGGNAFRSYVGSGTSLTIPDTVETLGAGAFYSYNGLSLHIPVNIIVIEANTFRNFVGTNEDLVIPSGVTQILGNAFRSFDGRSISMPNGITEIGTYAFYTYKGRELNLPTNLGTIGTYAFYNYKGRELNLPTNLETIGTYAFYNYNGNSLTLPSGLTSIGANSFYKYNGSDIVIPSSVTSIGANAFHDMDSTKTIIVKGKSSRPSGFASSFAGQAHVIYDPSSN